MDTMQAVAKMLEGKKVTNDYLKNAGFYLTIGSDENNSMPSFCLSHVNNRTKQTIVVIYKLTLADVTSVWELVD